MLWIHHLLSLCAITLWIRKENTKQDSFSTLESTGINESAGNLFTQNTDPFSSDTQPLNNSSNSSQTIHTHAHRLLLSVKHAAHTNTHTPVLTRHSALLWAVQMIYDGVLILAVAVLTIALTAANRSYFPINAERDWMESLPSGVYFVLVLII